jgi:hypothetical protein
LVDPRLGSKADSFAAKPEGVARPDHGIVATLT